MTSEQVKDILSTPVGLFMLMLLGSLLSMTIKFRDARSNGSKITFYEYFFTVDTLVMIGTNMVAFIALIMTDTLNWTNASAIGMGADSIADLFTPGKGRSAAVIDKVPDSN